MSPEALAVAIAALEADVVESQSFVDEAEANVSATDLLVARTTEQAQEAHQRLSAAQDALNYLYGLQDAQTGAEQLEGDQ